MARICNPCQADWARIANPRHLVVKVIEKAIKVVEVINLYNITTLQLLQHYNITTFFSIFQVQMSAL
jgi:hypothetical protein